LGTAGSTGRLSAELAIFDGKGWGKRPVAVIVDDLSAIDPGLVLFTAFVVPK
jgi:hypothetical protein